MKTKIHTLLAHAELIKMSKEELMELAVEFNYSLHVDELKSFIEKHKIQNKYYFTQMNGKINQLISNMKSYFTSTDLSVFPINNFVTNESIEPLFSISDLDFFQSKLENVC